MKIGIDIRSLLENQSSGVPEYTKELLKEIFALDRRNEYCLFYNAARDAAGRLPRYPYPNVSIRATRYPNKLFNNIMENFIGWPKLDRLLKADLFFMPNIGFAALSKTGRSVLTVHDLSFLRYGGFFSWKRRLWHAALRLPRLVGQYGTVVAVSENTKRDLVELCGLKPERIRVVYSGISNRFRPEGKDGERAALAAKYRLSAPYILYLGTLEPRKNISGLIRGYDECLGEHPGLKDHALVIAGGRGWKEGEIMAAWRSAKQRARIKFIGYVDDADRAALYRSAEMFVYPSFYEGFGFPPLEAMACGLPVVSSRAASLPEVAGGAALLVDPHNQNELAAALYAVLTDGSLKEKMRQRSLRAAARFSWRQAAGRYLEIFEEAAADAKAG
jgi:glycosyltransferase involved in cell wall biosynthesis